MQIFMMLNYNEDNENKYSYMIIDFVIIYI